MRYMFITHGNNPDTPKSICTYKLEHNIKGIISIIQVIDNEADPKKGELYCTYMCKECHDEFVSLLSVKR
jgi:hypothetical protein